MYEVTIALGSQQTNGYTTTYDHLPSKREIVQKLREPHKALYRKVLDCVAGWPVVVDTEMIEIAYIGEQQIGTVAFKRIW